MTAGDLTSIALVTAACLLMAEVFSVVIFEETAREVDGPDIELLTNSIASIRRLKRRLEEEEESDQITVSTKTSKKEHDCERARMCVHQDCIGLDPFFGNQFARVFRVDRSIFE